MRYVIAVFLAFTIAATADVKLADIFAENMVLQRDVPVPVWGWADDGEKVKITVYDRNAKVLAQAETVAQNGKFRLTLKAMPAGGRYTMLVQGKNMFTYTNVMVGEVWITCGQSNMIWPIEQTESVKEAIADGSKYPNIRHVQIGDREYVKRTQPQDRLKAFWGAPKWEDANYCLPRSSRTDIPGCQSAVSYYFARELTKYLKNKVPVGMVDIGAIIKVQSWVDPETVLADPVLKPLAGKNYPNATSRAYNANIAPLAPFPVRGAIYYQGEMNAGNAKIYKHGLTALIKSWRKAWNNPKMPFLIVQLPGFIVHKKEKTALDMNAESLAKFHQDSANHGFIGIREAQLQVWQSVPHTGMAITIDLGDPQDIHPRRKLPVAQRLFLQARQLVYGDKDVVASGPVPRKVEFDGKEVVVTFAHYGSGLQAKGELKGFEVAGADGKFVAAAARIEKDQVVCSAKEVPAPQAVRYAWAGFPLVTLYNREGLPATPFRWPVE